MTAVLRRILKAQHVKHERLKKAGVIEPRVFWRSVAEGRGGPKKPQPIISFGKAWKSACTAAGYPGRIPHDLRRTAIRAMVRHGTLAGFRMTCGEAPVRNMLRRGVGEGEAMKLGGVDNALDARPLQRHRQPRPTRSCRPADRCRGKAVYEALTQTGGSSRFRLAHGTEVRPLRS